jgi:hypothetical protein
VFEPNLPLRTTVTALAPGASTAPPAPIAEPAAEPAPRRAARYAWALLLARIYDRRKSLWDMPPAGQRAIDPQAQPAPAFEFDQRLTW